jgi:anti-sigma B factor antagonist
MVAESLTISSMAVNGTRIVLVGGELDLATAPQLADFLAAIEDANIVLDLWDLSFVDSAGFGVLFDAHQRFESEGKCLTLRWVHGTPWRAMQVLGLDTVLHLDRRPLRLAGA